MTAAAATAPRRAVGNGRNQESDAPLKASAGVDDEDVILGDEDVEVIPLRVEPLLQQNASPADIDKGLRLIQSCRDGDLAMVQRQLSEGSPAGFVTKTGWTPIASAAFSGKSEIVRYLIDIGADSMYVKTGKRHAASPVPSGSSAPWAPQGGSESTSSLNNGRQASTGTPVGEGTGAAHDANFTASETDDAALLHGGATTSPLNAMTRKSTTTGVNTPLHWACYKGHAELVTMLMQAGYGIEDVDPVGNRCLHLACSGGYRDVIEILLAHSAAVDQRNRYGNRPLDLATESSCRKLLLKFESQTTCEWCKESFSRLRHPSLCQHCHNVYCDVKPCSSITEIAAPSASGAASPSLLVRSMRYCQECASDMSKTEQELRSVLDAKLDLIRGVVALIAESSEPTPRPLEEEPSEQQDDGASPGTGSSPPPTDSPEGLEERGDLERSSSAENTAVDGSSGSAEMDGVEPVPPSEGLDTGISSSAPSTAIPRRRLLTNDDVFRALTLSRTDAEALYTTIGAAQLKAVDRELVQHAKQTYHQLVAHVALQEEVKALMVVRPIGVRSLIEPLKLALARAERDGVREEMLQLAVQVIRSAEAECTLFGCHAMCAKIELGSSKHQRDIARLEASISEAQALGVSDKLLAVAVALRDRLNAEVLLLASVQPFEPIIVTNDAGVEVVTGYRFVDDGVTVETLLQALEYRNQKVQHAVDVGTAVEGVSTALLEDGGNILKQLKKEIKDEMKNEEERRRLEEEAALKAAKKGKKKKA
ncbi:hypothetical protein P43SY_005918 [Pythium insidiosum]|uniref:Uncharacterized protein n=1 Tax=Pythium insidiosum TaxID=114742 RepID=A0AAD5Q7X4_PYTIN|nr:hypothetical protein P43SY_005918 [Pythium insidiosum]